ncbi:MAG: hypothetical protein ABR898_08215 [Terracidiphilus sp.]
MEPTMGAGVEPAGGARAPLGPVVKIDEGRIRDHLDEVVRSTVEEILNALLDAEADHLCGARRVAHPCLTHNWRVPHPSPPFWRRVGEHEPQPPF